MKKNNKSIGILIAVIVGILAFIFIAVILFYSKNGVSSGIDSNNPGSIDLTGYPNTGDVTIRSASYLYTDDGKVEGYLVTVSSKGYKDNILMDITFDNTGNIVKSVVIKDHKESKDYGAKIAEEAFLSQFNGITAPVVLSGSTSGPGSDEGSATDEQVPDTSDTTASEEQTSENTASATDGTGWTDGTYEAEEAEFDDQGYKDKVAITIQDGKMTELIWDAYNADGQLKSVLSADGAYEMTDRGPTWQEQAVAITDYVIQNQSTDTIIMNAEGKTDTVTGVSISVNDFISLVQECLSKAAAAETPAQTSEEPSSDNTAEEPSTSPEDDDNADSGSQIDAVSGATISSAAVVNGINKAQSFIKDFVLSK